MKTCHVSGERRRGNIDEQTTLKLGTRNNNTDSMKLLGRINSLIHTESLEQGLASMSCSVNTRLLFVNSASVY